MANYEPYQFSKVASFGTVTSVKNQYSGVSIPTFVPSFSLHYFKKNQTINQKYLALNTSYEDSLILVVRHDSRLNDQLVCKIDNTEYKIINISSDDSNYISYDLVTVTKTKKVGG